MKLKQKRTKDGIQIINTKDGQNVLMAIIPTEEFDEAYIKEVMKPFADTICNLPHLLKQIEAAEHLLIVVGELKFAEQHVDDAIIKLRELLKKG